MPQSLVHLPNGQTLTVQPVFGGLFFKSNDLHTHHSAFPPGWTIILNSEDDEDDHLLPHASSAAHTDSSLATDQEPLKPANAAGVQGIARPATPKRHHIHRFRKPSLQNDHLFISSISNPSSSEFKPSSSPTRSIAMMLWATLWWYFHQPEPAPQMTHSASVHTPEEGRPKGEWRVNINREGIFKGKHLLPKLERMGLIATEDSSVGLDPMDGVGNAGEGWTKMFVSRKSFWQMDARIYLFTLSPTQASSPYPSVSPASSRPASPSRIPPSGLGMTAAERRSDDERALQAGHQILGATFGQQAPPNPLSRNSLPGNTGPFESSSHLPTFYPPPPLQWTFSNGVRHPVRPKPSRQGETFYTRYVPSLGQYISFRVASMIKTPCIYRGPTSAGGPGNDVRIVRSTQNSEAAVPTVASLNLKDASPNDTTTMTDVELLHKWMNNPRVAHSWGEDGPIAHQGAFLSAGLTSQHSVPIIGCFDGKPFGYFEVYYVKEDRLAAHLSAGSVGEWDRGLHCLVGEEEFRGPHRVKVWLSALTHFCWLADMRTQVVFMEPRVDNVKYAPLIFAFPNCVLTELLQVEEVLRGSRLLQRRRSLFPA